MLAKAKREHPDAELTQIDAADLGDGRFASLIGGSLFASWVIVVINDLGNLPEQAFPLVKQTALNPDPEICLILVHQGKKGKKLIDALVRQKITKIPVESIKSWKLPTFVTAEARRMRMSMDARAAQDLIDAVGSDLRSLASAVSQLAADYEGEHVSGAMVRRYFAGRAEITSFAVVDDALAGRSAQALEKLRWAIQTGVAPVLITSAMAGSLRSLGKYVDLRSSQLAEVDLARQVGVPQWKIKDLSKLARQWSPRGIAVAIREVAKVDEQVKGLAADPGFALEQLLFGIEGARRLGRRN